MKKTKLFLFICMICFCISFLYFGMYGVYAAQSVTYSISGTITYTAPIKTIFGNVTLIPDPDNEYWYIEFGKEASGNEAEKLRWRLISLDGSTKYTYSTTKPIYQSGAIFLQESTLLNGTSYMSQKYNETRDTDGNYNNWYNSTIRTYVNTPSNYGLTASDMSTYVKPRTITGIENYGSTEGTYIYTNASNNYSGKTTDNFWLLSSQEINKFLGSDSDKSLRIWKPYNYTSAFNWWSRTPDSRYNVAEYMVQSIGYFNIGSADLSPNGIRAAFQLA